MARRMPTMTNAGTRAFAKLTADIETLLCNARAGAHAVARHGTAHADGGQEVRVWAGTGRVAAPGRAAPRAEAAKRCQRQVGPAARRRKRRAPASRRHRPSHSEWHPADTARPRRTGSV